ncbi:MAG TPA: hypothetical protein VLF40_04250 [Candidatus Saccharimonadales bacterium]|nr:hypothetical protein [Candidatus Saccharimonadales bacterium]
MKRLLNLFVLSIVIAALVPSLASAAKAPAPAAPELVGYDVSYPQCGKRLPTDQYFAVVGVNGGTAANTNPCLADQLAWANGSKSGSHQPKVQLYVNTANPGEVISQITTWPTSNTDKTGYTTANPYGTCAGANDRACSWQYGWNRSVEASLDRFVPAARAAGISQSASAYTWWLDVETANTWQSGSTEALIRNTAALEGMTSYYKAQGAAVGLYSTAVQWSQITGNNVVASSNLNGLPNWRPSGASLANAISNCSVPPLTAGGYISLTQYVQKNLDHNHSCA